MGARLDNAKRLYMEGIRDGDYVSAIHAYAGDRYIQHSTPVKDGKEGFIEFFADFVRRNPVRDIQIVRGFEDGQYVFVHALQRLNGGESAWVTADIFDTDDQARMIEHWDIIGERVDETVSGHSQVDGPTEPTDLDRTDENRALVSRFIAEILESGEYDEIDRFISTESFIQHNPRIGDGVEGFRRFVESLAERGLSMTYQETHKIVACGNFVAALSEVDLAGTEMAVIDLYRVEAGRIVEHWDVMEEILPRDQWVNSGKF